MLAVAAPPRQWTMVFSWSRFHWSQLPMPRAVTPWCVVQRSSRSLGAWPSRTAARISWIFAVRHSEKPGESRSRGAVWREVRNASGTGSSKRAGHRSRVKRVVKILPSVWMPSQLPPVSEA